MLNGNKEKASNTAEATGDSEMVKHAYALGSDIIFLNGTISPLTYKSLAEELSKGELAEKALLILVTFGGDPDGAFRLGSLLQKLYKNGYITFVTGWCKSAGTLVALGSREIVMAPTGELGPLDIQIAKEDDLLARHSGLDMLHGIHNLIEHSFSAFERFFLDILGKSGGSITTRTASKIATEMVIGLFSQAFSQVEPVRLGALARANRIGVEYAVRLGASPEVAQRLVSRYPAHSFVIDIREARQLFGGSKTIRRPNEGEQELLNTLMSVGAQVEIPEVKEAQPRVWLASYAESQVPDKLKESEAYDATQTAKPARDRRANRASDPGKHKRRAGSAS